MTWHALIDILEKGMGIEFSDFQRHDFSWEKCLSKFVSSLSSIKMLTFGPKLKFHILIYLGPPTSSMNRQKLINPSIRICFQPNWDFPNFLAKKHWEKIIIKAVIVIEKYISNSDELYINRYNRPYANTIAEIYTSMWIMSIAFSTVVVWIQPSTRQL